MAFHQDHLSFLPMRLSYFIGNEDKFIFCLFLFFLNFKLQSVILMLQEIKCHQSFWLSGTPIYFRSFFFFKQPLFLEQFQVYSKTERRVHGFPIYPCSHSCIAFPIINQSGTFVIMDECMLMQHYPPKAIVYIKDDSWYCTFYCCLVAKSHQTLLLPYGLHSPPGSSVHGIFQARILERVAISFFRGSS